MVVYNLDETPDFFITPAILENEFVYTVALIKGEDNWKPIRSIDLRNDKLIIYGTEIKESMFKRLYESLIIKTQTVIFVNCNGECYVYLGGKFYRPIYNVIFDWSSFGVIVPNSMNDLLKKRAEELEKAVEKSNKEGELARIEVEGRNNEINELKRVQNESSLELQKAYEKVGLINSELEGYKIELELRKKESDEVLDELRSCKEDKSKMEVELQKTCDQHSSEILTFKKVNDDLEKKSKLLENEVLVVRSELHATKDQLDVSRRNAKELEEQLCMAKEELSQENEPCLMHKIWSNCFPIFKKN